MTDEINLDDIEVESDEEKANPGDWFWRGNGDPEDEPDGDTAADSGATDAPVPHVPSKNKDKPVGIPKETGGAGGDSTADSGVADNAPSHPDTNDDEPARGPHGGGIDEMTMALTYEAMKHLEEPLLVVQDARAWADWVGIVGNVEAFVINKFQREHNIDIDFFNGSGQGPSERLADIGKHSMFFAERMVVVGRPDEEDIAAQADWEFIPLEEAADKADWELTDD